MPAPGGAVFIQLPSAYLRQKDYMSKAETLRNIRVLLVIHLGGEHIIRPRVDFEVAVERLIDHQRFAGFRVRGDSEYLIQLVLKVQVSIRLTR